MRAFLLRERKRIAIIDVQTVARQEPVITRSIRSACGLP